jgi:transcriptional regulator with XRE-family HTH domain
VKEDRTEVQVDQPDFGIRIKNLRRDKNLSQRALADLIDRSEDFINMIERGRSFVSLDTLERLKQVFQVPMESLFTTAETKPLSRVGDSSGVRRGLLLI